MKRLFLMYAAFGIFALMAFFFGCEKTFIGPAEQNKAPEVWLSSGPVEGDTVGYQVHFYWGGWDPDGEVKSYEFVVAAGNPYGFDPEDTTGLDKWTKTMVHDSLFRVPANDTARDAIYSGNTFTRYDMTHTFFLRSIDLEGKRSEAVYLSFTAWTLAPYVEITMPRAPVPVTKVAELGRVIKFEWVGRDPIDSPENLKDPDSVRYMYHRVDSPGGGYDPLFDIIGDLNKNPWRYEENWSPWIWYRAADDSGRSTRLGDEEILEVGSSHIFAVQAKDEAGAVTAIFDRRNNIRQFIVSVTAVPYLTITEPFLGGFRFIGTNLRPEKRDVPPGIQLNFRWRANAEDYGGEIVCYQYGWDVADLNDPSDWDSDCSPYVLTCAAKWFSGVHTLFVRVVDNSGSESLGQIEINIIPFTMERNLLWIDDFPSTNFSQKDYTIPTESGDPLSHDVFWLGHCQRAIGFDKDRDVYDVYYGNGGVVPKITLIAKYKNIIWSYASDVNKQVWDNVVKFTAESAIGSSRISVNFLSLFLSKGGHLITEGNSERANGLAASLHVQQPFPMNLKCETTGNQEGCEGDTSGVNCYPYKDYCITMLDKIVGAIRTTTGMPLRRVRNYDCMFPGARLSSDVWNTTVPGMPATLDLWEEVVKAGRFFDPAAADPYPGGFTLVEIYDPTYWMRRNLIMRSQGCFHPMYLMQAKNTSSGLHNQAVALWVTKYADILPEVTEGIAVAAPSAHFGFELWYFNRAQGTAIINAIFAKWGLLATP
jgi:hypothetical protein